MPRQKFANGTYVCQRDHHAGITIAPNKPTAGTSSNPNPAS